MTKSILLTGLLLVAVTSVFAQLLEQKISFEAENESIESILGRISEDHDISFSYLNNQLPQKRLSVSFFDMPLKEALSGLLGRTDLTFIEHEGKVIIKQKTIEDEKEEPVAELDQPIESDSVNQISIDEANAATYALRDSVQVNMIDTTTQVVFKSSPKLDTIPDQAISSIDTTSTSGPGIKITYIPDTTNLDEPLDSLPVTPVKYKVLHFGTMYPFSSNGPDAADYINNISFHLLSGYSRGLKGFELSGVANISKASIEGFQMAGVSNTVGDRVQGIQLAGITNVAKGDVTGSQIAGVANVSKGNHQGAQISGIANVVSDTVSQFQISGVVNLTKGVNEFGQISGLVNKADRVNGLQLSGFLNLQKQIRYRSKSSKKPSNGVQIAGFMNRAGKINGVQISGVSNYAHEVRGLQISGLVNKANYVKGAQIGIINIANQMEGASIGLFSVVKHNGYLDLELFYADDFSGNAIIKVGSKYFHNLFGLSYDLRSKERWAYGYGFGSQFGNGMIRLNTDLMSYYVIEQDFPNAAFRDFKLNLLNKFRFIGSIHIGDFGVFGGPVLNVMVSKLNEDGLVSQLPNPPQITSTNSSGTTTSFWVGYNFGIRF